MPLLRPQFVVLDSATLGNVSRDYWRQDKTDGAKARTFVTRLRERSIYITFTLTHVLELLRHEDESVVRDRLKFLRGLPMIAWLRPYDRSWFPAGVADFLRRELHAVVHDAKRDWPAIVEHVRTDLWETGQGSEMFVNDDHLWDWTRTAAKDQQESDQYVASVARDRCRWCQRFAGRGSKTVAETTGATTSCIHAAIRRSHGGAIETAWRSTARRSPPCSGGLGTLNNLDWLDAAGGDPIQRLLEHHTIAQTCRLT